MAYLLSLMKTLENHTHTSVGKLYKKLNSQLTASDSRRALHE